MPNQPDALYRIIIDHPYMAYPSPEHTINKVENSASFPIGFDVTIAHEVSNIRNFETPEYYSAYLPYIHAASELSKFASLYGYHEQVAIIGLSDTLWSTPIVKCGKYGTGLCHKERLCPYCARNKATERWTGFSELYFHAEWSFLTVSYDGHMSFSDREHVRWLTHWDAATNAIKRLCKVDIIPGAFIREELSLHEYTPQQVKPHIHAVVSRDLRTLDPSWQDLLRSFMEGYRDDEGNGIDMPIDISVEAIKDFKEFRHKFYYMQKAVDLSTPYKAALNRMPNANIYQIAHLNRSCRDFTESYLAGTFRKTQTFNVGDLDKRLKSYLGNTNIYQLAA